jgi:hypothetical protein
MIVPDKHCALPWLVQRSVAAAFTAGAGLRATRPRIYYAASFERMRMEECFTDMPIFDASRYVHSADQLHEVRSVMPRIGHIAALADDRNLAYLWR